MNSQKFPLSHIPGDKFSLKLRNPNFATKIMPTKFYHSNSFLDQKWTSNSFK